MGAELRLKVMGDKMTNKMMDKVRVRVVSKKKNTSKISIKLNRSINLINNIKIIMSNNSISSINHKIKLDKIIHI